MSTTSLQIYGVANLLEGEGCFSFRTTPMITLKMTDEDIIARTRSLMCSNSKITIESHSDKKGWKPSYSITISGSLAVQWMMTIYSLMGRRRKEKIREILIKWKEMPYKQKNSDYCKKGHPLLVEGQDYSIVLSPSGNPVKKCKICRNENQTRWRNDDKPKRDAIKAMAFHKNISIKEAEKMLDELLGKTVQ